MGCGSWDAKKFTDEFISSECYQKPLELEEGNEGTFLEVRYRIEDNRIRYKIKNDNEGEETKVWRYQHFQSGAPFLQKRATLMACLRKVQCMASDPLALVEGALAKIAEFQRLRYPISILTKACVFLAANTGETAWFRVKDKL